MGCGVGCVVCAKPSDEKKARLASSNLKERLMMRVNSGSVFNGNNKLAFCQNCQHCTSTRDVSHGAGFGRRLTINGWETIL